MKTTSDRSLGDVRFDFEAEAAVAVEHDEGDLGAYWTRLNEAMISAAPVDGMTTTCSCGRLKWVGARLPKAVVEIAAAVGQNRIPFLSLLLSSNTVESRSWLSVDNLGEGAGVGTMEVVVAVVEQ